MNNSNQIAIIAQNNIVQHLTIPVAQYAWRHEDRIDLYDISSHSDFKLNSMNVDWSKYSRVVIFGSVQLVKMLSDTELSDHIYYRSDIFDTSSWVAAFGERALNFNGCKMPAICVGPFLGAYGDHHIRPNSNDKLFNGGVYSSAQWIEQMNNINEKEECFVSPVIDIKHEYRCWFVNGNLVEVSRYFSDNTLNKARMPQSHLIWTAANNLAEYHLPLNNIVMDVAELQDGSFRFIEFNSIHSSGWYLGDVAIIIDAITEAQ